MNITITGSKGFIGSHLKSRILAEGHSITEWDRNLGNDIANFSIDYIKETEVFSEPSVIAATNMVIHLAASADVRKSVEEPDHYWENNVINTKKVQDICFNMKIPMLYASSSCVHAWSLSPYGTSKKINELTAYPGQIGLKAIPTHVIDTWLRVIYQFLVAQVGIILLDSASQILWLSD